jgi:hypothetical protein
MAADFGINVEIISEEALQAEIDKIIECLKNAGIEIETNVDEPGLAALIATLIKSIEKAIISAYEPVIALVNVVTEAIDAGFEAVKVFLEKIVKVVEGITELLSKLPMSIIEFIVNKVLEPIMKHINIPFPNIQGIIEIISGAVSLNNINWKQWLKDGKLTIPEKLRAKGEEKVNQVLTLFENFNGMGIPFIKLLELLLFPFKFAIGVIQGILKKVQELVTNLFDAINEIVEIVSNPVQWVLDFIGGIFADVLAMIAKVFIPISPEDIQLFIAKFKELILSIFKIGAIKLDIDKWIDGLPPRLKAIFKQVVGFVKLIQCFIFWLVGLLTPQTILNIFGLNNFKFPPVKATKWTKDSRNFTINLGDMTAEDLAKMFKPNDKITIQRGSQSEKEGIVEIVSGNIIKIKEQIYSSDFEDTVKITKKV